MGAGDPGAAVDTDLVRPAGAEPSKRAASACASRNRPSSPVFSEVGADTAPGMWPPTRSIGSTSPR